MTDNQTQAPEPKPASNTRWIVLAVGGGLVLLACVVLAVALVVARLLPSVSPIAVIDTPLSATSNPLQAQTAVNVVMPAARPHPQADGNKMGDPNAPVKIIEYADFQCPYCLNYWQETEPQIIQNYIVSGKVHYEYRSVGAFIGPDSGAAAQAAYCAADQNAFWPYHDILFANWSGENAGEFARDKLGAYAAALGLDQSKFAACLDGGQHAADVQQDVSDAKAAGIRATPSFLVNGKLVEGALPYADFQMAIEAALTGP